MAKGLQTTASATLSVDQEEISQEKDHKKKHTKNHIRFNHGFNERKKKAVNSVILKNF